MSQRICNSQSEPYWWKPGWHPIHMSDIKNQASRPRYEADSFMIGITAFLRAKMAGQEQQKSKQAKFRQRMENVSRRLARKRG